MKEEKAALTDVVKEASFSATLPSNSGLKIGYCYIKKLVNFDQLPGNGIFVSCFPFKLKALSAGVTRTVAIIDSYVFASWHMGQRPVNFGLRPSAKARTAS